MSKPIPILGTPLVLMSSVTQSQRTVSVPELGPGATFLNSHDRLCHRPHHRDRRQPRHTDRHRCRANRHGHSDLQACAHGYDTGRSRDIDAMDRSISIEQSTARRAREISGDRRQEALCHRRRGYHREPGATGLPHLGGLAARDPEWADTVQLIGYPPVPYSQQTAINAHTDEVAQPACVTYDNDELFPYSPTARAGNSGGPSLPRTEGSSVSSRANCHTNCSQVRLRFQWRAHSRSCEHSSISELGTGFVLKHGTAYRSSAIVAVDRSSTHE